MLFRQEVGLICLFYVAQQIVYYQIFTFTQLVNAAPIIVHSMNM